MSVAFTQLWVYNIFGSKVYKATTFRKQGEWSPGVGCHSCDCVLPFVQQAMFGALVGRSSSCTGNVGELAEATVFRLEPAQMTWHAPSRLFHVHSAAQGGPTHGRAAGAAGAAEGVAHLATARPAGVSARGTARLRRSLPDSPKCHARPQLRRRRRWLGPCRRPEPRSERQRRLHKTPRVPGGRQQRRAQEAAAAAQLRPPAGAAGTPAVTGQSTPRGGGRASGTAAHCGGSGTGLYHGGGGDATGRWRRAAGGL